MFKNSSIKNRGIVKGYKTPYFNDIIYTPEHIAKYMINLYDIKGTILDGFAGKNVFYDNYPSNVKKFKCEISKGTDFFEFKDKVDWIVTNPPYSNFTRTLEHSFKIADNVCYLIPMGKMVSSMKRIKMINEYGGVVSNYFIGANKCGFPFGFPVTMIHMKRGYKGRTLNKVIDSDFKTYFRFLEDKNG